tara:strand:- start:337 stop:561 length:225 start_codon:yes stop_codon:yes gene_type:complete
MDDFEARKKQVQREEHLDQGRRKAKRYRERMKKKGFRARLIYMDPELEFKLRRYAEVNGLKPWADFNTIIKRFF